MPHWLLPGPRCLTWRMDIEDCPPGDDSWRRGHKGWGWAGLHQGPALTPHPEPCFSSSLSHNSISLESALGLVKTLPSCPHIREASVK